MNIRKYVVGHLTGVALIISVHSAARADILVSNLDQPFRADTPIAEFEFWAGQSFVSGVDNFLLTSIEAIVGNGANAPLVIAQLRRSDINGAIDATAGGLIATFSAPDVSGATSVRSFLPDSMVNLVSTDLYWFVLGSGNAGTYDWSYAEGPLTTGPGALSSYSDSSDGGVTWTLGDSVDPYFIRVNGVANVIPEPSSSGLVVATGFGLLSLVRRRRILR